MQTITVSTQNLYRAVNDYFRSTRADDYGDVFIFRRAASLPAKRITAMLKAIESTTTFDNEDHNAGSITLQGRTYRWRIGHFKDKSKSAFADRGEVGYRSLIIADAEDCKA
ncbi:hypothetical protein ABIA16_003596 [Sinorhizobium fredii]